MLVSVRPLLAAAFLVAGCAGLKPAASMDDAQYVGRPEEGRALAADMCAACHATGAKGDSPLAAAPPFRTLLASYPADRLVVDLGDGALMGHAPLPSIYLNKRSAKDLVAYLSAIASEKAP